MTVWQEMECATRYYTEVCKRKHEHQRVSLPVFHQAMYTILQNPANAK